jgi:hypothetical protein
MLSQWPLFRPVECTQEVLTLAGASPFFPATRGLNRDHIKMLPHLSPRTYDLMRRAIDTVDRDTADLITTMVASAFVDGKNDQASRDQETSPKKVKEFA